MTNTEYKERNKLLIAELENDLENKELMETFLLFNEKLIHKICHKEIARIFTNGVSNYEDVYQTAMIAMMDAVHVYIKEHKKDEYEHFSSFAYVYIQRKVKSELAELAGAVKIPYSTQKKYKIQATVSNELDTSLNIRKDESMDYIPEIQVLLKEQDIELYKAISKLSKREQYIIINRYGLFGKEPKTQVKISDVLGVSQAAIHDCEKKIQLKLKKILEKTAQT